MRRQGKMDHGKSCLPGSLPDTIPEPRGKDFGQPMMFRTACSASSYKCEPEAAGNWPE
jgi:hypothetical protein